MTILEALQSRLCLRRTSYEATSHAPKGGASSHGKDFRGGEFVPRDASGAGKGEEKTSTGEQESKPVPKPPQISPEIAALNADLKENGDLPSLVAQDHGFYSHVKMRTRPPAKGEIFLRVGKIPYSGQSTNHKDNVKEEGVSAYHVIDGKLVNSSPFSPGFEGKAERYWITGQVMQIDLKGDGEFKDLKGADGEPLLYNARYVMKAGKIPATMKQQRGASEEAKPEAPAEQPQPRGDVTQSPAFRAWFAGSKVVDGEGKPLVVHHGTMKEFTEFDPAIGSEYGIYTTPKRKYAEMYGGGKAKSFYLSIKNPLVVDNKGEISPRDITKGDIDALIAKGYDGIISVTDRSAPWKADEVVAFHPSQVKSATGNRGTFDPSSNRIDYERSQRLLERLHHNLRRVLYEAHHAPVGGVTVAGTFFKGGEFIPGDVMAKATAEEKAKVEGKAEGKTEQKTTARYKLLDSFKEATAWAITNGAPVLPKTEKEAAAKIVEAFIANDPKVAASESLQDQIRKNWTKNLKGRIASADPDLALRVQNAINLNYSDPKYRSVVEKNGPDVVVFMLPEGGKTRWAAQRIGMFTAVYQSGLMSDLTESKPMPGAVTSSEHGGLAADLRHEYGHYLYDKRFGSKAKAEFVDALPERSERKSALTTYSATNDDETFCELFATIMHKDYDATQFVGWVGEQGENILKDLS